MGDKVSYHGGEWVGDFELLVLVREEREELGSRSVSSYDNQDKGFIETLGRGRVVEVTTGGSGPRVVRWE